MGENVLKFVVFAVIWLLFFIFCLLIYIVCFWFFGVGIKKIFIIVNIGIKNWEFYKRLFSFENLFLVFRG